MFRHGDFSRLIERSDVAGFLPIRRVDAHKGDANVVIVDCEVDAAYARGHISGAVLVPDNFEKDPDSGRVHLMNPNQFKTRA